MSERKIVGYRIAHEIFLEDLEDNVMRRIQAGWQPYGNPFEMTSSADYGKKDVPTCQAMVKYEDNK
jgi:hypothetical protein